MVHDNRPSVSLVDDEPHLWKFETRPACVYVAASVHNQFSALKVGMSLAHANFRVTSRWLSYEFNKMPNDREHQVAASEEMCGVDLQDLCNADTLIVLADVPSSSGGLHVELGYFLGLGKKNVLVVGEPRKNVFWYHQDVRWMPDRDGILEFMVSEKHGR